MKADLRLLYLRATNAIRRCTDPRDPAYRNYGGRGVSVHPPWVVDPWAFVAYLTLLPGFDVRGLVMDRIDNDGGYVPGNLRFVTWGESNCNRRGRAA